MNDLLHDPILRVDNGDAVDLPTLLHRLATTDRLELLGLQAHQSHAVHAFLVQLAALALRRVGIDDPSRLTVEQWRELLFELVEAEETAWQLVVDDWEKPAFLQPPVPADVAKEVKTIEATPQAIGTLVLAKNHDIKSGRDFGAPPDHWIYGLIDVQTMQGYSGAGNYGVARMNSGFGNRPAFGYSPDAGWPARWRRDLATMLEARSETDWSLYGFDVSNHEAVELMWLQPWDGRSSLRLSNLDPWVIEVSRRIRLVETADGRIEALRATSKTSRIDKDEAKERMGNLGDLWMPVRLTKDRPAALTVGNAGLTYRLIVDLLFGKNDQKLYELSPALTLRVEDGGAGSDVPGNPVLVAQVLVRGQGQTNGYHRRRIPVARTIVPLLNDPEGLEAIGRLAQVRVETVSDTQRRVLRPAICALLQGGADELKLNDPLAREPVDRFDAEVDRIFFDRLWRDVDRTHEEQSTVWHDELLALARGIFEDAARSLPIPETRRYRALASGEGRLWGGARRVLTAATVFHRTETAERDPAPSDLENRPEGDAA